jgi:hypothetical protein
MIAFAIPFSDGRVLHRAALPRAEHIAAAGRDVAQAVAHRGGEPPGKGSSA